MRARFSKTLNWRRVLRLSVGIGVGTCAVVGVGTVSLAAASCWRINRIRPRTYTDNYHLNPENLRMPYRNVEFSAEDGPILKGWWIPATVHGRESNRIVILMHPYNNHKSNLLGLASALWSQGYSVFMFDFRSFATNAKTRQTIGYLEQFDAIAAINYVKHNYYWNKNGKAKQIVVMGASMGGACAICSAKYFINNNNNNIISAIVTDCTFSTLREICKYRIGIAALWFPTGLLNVVVNIMDIGNQFIYGYSVDDVAPFDVVRDSQFDIPLLLLHSECDAAVPFAHSQQLYKHANSKIKNLYCIKNGDHCAGYFINPNLFTKYLIQWVDDVLDYEMIERKQMKKEGKVSIDVDDHVITNNEFIMFDTQGDIGLDHDDDDDAIFIQDNNKVIIDGITNDNTASSTLWSSFFKK
eukprot:34264_1